MFEVASRILKGEPVDSSGKSADGSFEVHAIGQSEMSTTPRFHVSQVRNRIFIAQTFGSIGGASEVPRSVIGALCTGDRRTFVPAGIGTVTLDLFNTATRQLHAHAAMFA